MGLLEAVMLLCFGAAWPFSIYLSSKSSSTNGKSFIFLLVLILGSLAGILNKLLYHYDAVVYLYILNVLMVSTDAALWLRNRRRERRMEAA